MRTLFDPEVRVLACDRCGAPFEGSSNAFEFNCRFCGAQNRVGVAETLPPTPPISREEQTRRLVAQVGKVREPNPAIVAFLDGDRLAPWREREALAAWLEARRGLGSAADDGSRFYELTRLLAEAAQRTGEDLRERALLETGFQACRLPRHRTVLAATLAQRALKVRDVQSAQVWISRCDPGVDDLEAFSALLLARALFAHHQDQSDKVLQELGSSGRETVCYPSDEATAAVLRAHAHERSGQVEAAVATLELAVARRWPKSRAEVELARQALGTHLCPQAYQRLAEVRGAKARTKHVYNLIVLLVFAVLWGGGGAGALYAVLSYGQLGWLVGVLVGGAFASFLLFWGVPHELRNWNTWRSPVWGTVQALSRRRDSDSSNSADVVLDCAPQKVERVSFLDADTLHPGMRALFVKGTDSVDWLD